MNSYRRALTIAGSDSGGGAGIQADLKTFSALGCYGMSVITAVTAQNTVAVTAIHAIPTHVIEAQIDAVLSDIGTDAIKIGMLATPEIIESVAKRLAQHPPAPLVLDPVMVSKSGDALLEGRAVSTLRSSLLPLATVLTPNVPEAEVLTGQSIASSADLEDAAHALLALGPEAVLLKGGHLDAEDTSDDCLVTRESTTWLCAPRVATPHTHGTGCTLSSAIAALLARGESLTDAVSGAKAYISKAIGAARPLGAGHGPVHHFHAWWL